MGFSKDEYEKPHQVVTGENVHSEQDVSIKQQKNIDRVDKSIDEMIIQDNGITDCSLAASGVGFENDVLSTSSITEGGSENPVDV